ncbi:MAG: hypothetical protein M5U15_00020 [Kiritimatiellae bacterium]|nr:hypothetical protein [Kiritimatiellia bacterium]
MWRTSALRLPSSGPQPFRRVHGSGQRFSSRGGPAFGGRSGCHLASVFVGVHAVRELDPEAVHAARRQAVGVPQRRLVPGVVGIVGNADAPHLPGKDRVEQFIGEPVRPVDERHIAEPVYPERQRIERGLAQDDFRFVQGLGVPYPGVRSGQVQMMGRAFAQALGDLAAVDFGHVAAFVEDRQHQRTVKVFVSGFPEQAQRLQPRPDRRAVLPVLVRQPQAQRPVGEAEPEAVDGLLVVQSPPPQVVQGGGRFQESFVVVVHHLAHERRVVRLRDRTAGRAGARSLS